MIALQERLNEFDEAGAAVLDVSADSPFTLGAFREEHRVEFNLITDMVGESIMHTMSGLTSESWASTGSRIGPCSCLTTREQSVTGEWPTTQRTS